MPHPFEDTILDPNTVAGKLYILLNEVKFDRIFQTQEDIRLAYGERFPDEPIPKQPTISKALKQISKINFDFENVSFTFLDMGRQYEFFPCQWEFIALFDDDFIFHKNTVLTMSNNTLVFHLHEKYANKFVKSIQTLFPPDLFWGISIQGEYVFLMFDVYSRTYKNHFAGFQRFFENHRNYHNKIDYRRIATLRMRKPRRKTEEKRNSEEENR